MFLAWDGFGLNLLVHVGVLTQKAFVLGEEGYLLSAS